MQQVPAAQLVDAMPCGAMIVNVFMGRGHVDSEMSLLKALTRSDR